MVRADAGGWRARTNRYHLDMVGLASNWRTISPALLFVATLLASCSGPPLIPCDLADGSYFHIYVHVDPSTGLVVRAVFVGLGGACSSGSPRPSARKRTVLVEREDVAVGVLELRGPATRGLCYGRDDLDPSRGERGDQRVDAPFGEAEDHL